MLWELFELCCVHGKHDEANELLGALEENGQESVGDFYYNLGCKLQPNNPSALLGAATASVHLGDRQAGSEYLDRVRRLAPGNPGIPNVVRLLREAAE